MKDLGLRYGLMLLSWDALRCRMGIKMYSLLAMDMGHRIAVAILLLVCLCGEYVDRQI